MAPQILRTRSRTSRGKSAVAVVFFCGLFPLDGLLLIGAFRFTGELFFQCNTEGPAVGFNVLLRPASEGR